MLTAFNCCVQCQNFLACNTRTENYEKELSSACCNSCSKLDICKIVTEKIKTDTKGIIQ
ncbi:MAG: hypothetical protein ABH847_03435 [Candidatus Omnitrophota bacterium]